MHALLFQLSSFEQFVVSMAFIVVFLVISHELVVIHDPAKCIAAGSSHVPSCSASSVARPCLFQMFVVLCLRCAVMNWSFPTFTEEDNPASFHELIYVRSEIKKNIL